MEGKCVLTEWHRAGNLPSVRAVRAIRGRTTIRHNRGHEERIRTKRLNLEHLIRLLDGLAQPDGFLEFLLPLIASLCGISEERPQATQSTIMMNSARVDCA